MIRHSTPTNISAQSRTVEGERPHRFRAIVPGGADRLGGDPRGAQVSTVERLAFTPEEAAASIGCSRSFLYEHILPELRVVRVGRRRIIPRESLEQWLREEASRAIG